MIKTLLIKDVDAALFNALLDNRVELVSESPSFRSLLTGVDMCRYRTNYDWEYVRDNLLTSKALNLKIMINDEVISYENKK